MTNRRTREEAHWNLRVSISSTIGQVQELMDGLRHDDDSDPAYVAQEVLAIVREQLLVAKAAAVTADFIEEKLGL
jgi:hypothetical protein